MYQRRQQIATTRRQWRYLSSRLKRWVESGRFAAFSAEKQTRLRTRLHGLLRRMARLESAGRLRKALGGAALLLGLGAAPAQAQVNFGPVQENPFGLGSHNQTRFDVLADMDNDGDLDLVSLGYSDENYESQKFEYRENLSTDGGATPIFGAIQDLPGLTLPQVEEGIFLRHDLADLDNDGDLDLMIGFYDYYEGKVYYFENEGTAEAAAFGNLQLNPFGTDFGTSIVSTPNLADLDGDGDLDLLSLHYAYDYDTETYEIGFVYQENTGTVNDPVFGNPVRSVFGLPEQLDSPTFFELGDIDNDGDIDILAGDSYLDYYSSTIDYQFYENIGDAANPAFAAVQLNPFGLVPPTANFLWPALGDLDNDGDLDVLVGSTYDYNTYEGGWAYQENLLLDVAVEDLADELTEVAVFPTVSRGNFNLRVRTQASPLTLTLDVFTPGGERLQRTAYPSGTELNAQVDLTAYPAGTYHLRLSDGDRQWTGTVIKQ